MAESVTIALRGRIDSTNAEQTENEILEQLSGKDGAAVVIDASSLEYISSIGLRILLRLKKAHPPISSGLNRKIFSRAATATIIRTALATTAATASSSLELIPFVTLFTSIVPDVFCPAVLADLPEVPANRPMIRATSTHFQ